MWLRIFLLLLFINGVGLYGLWYLFGGAREYQDVSAEPVIPASQLEVVVSHNEPIGNVAVSAQGRLFFTVHPEAATRDIKLAEWRDGQAIPFPSRDFQEQQFDAPLGLVIDTLNRLWVIDHGSHGLGQPMLWAFDLDDGSVLFQWAFSSERAGFGSFFQDVQVDRQGRYVFIADLGLIPHDPAIVILDTETKRVRRVLSSHPSIQGQPWQIGSDASPMALLGGLIHLQPGVDGLVLDNNDHYLYYGAMANDSLYRIRVEHLLDLSLSEEGLAQFVERVGTKPLSDGLSIDNEGNVYITDIEHNAILVMDQKGELTTLVKDPQIRWPDGLSFGPDGWLYITDSALQTVVFSPEEKIREAGPYHIFRVQTGKQAEPGH